jgi:prepilin-type N-terminal cleavage/methylation domain-containing protein
MAARSLRGFTLVELLVVVAILSLLLAMLLPVMGDARELARRAACGANLRSLSQAGSLHAGDHDGWYPQTNRNNEQSKYGPYGFLRFWRIDRVDASDDRWYGGGLNPNAWHRTGTGDNVACNASEPIKVETAWKHYGTPWSEWAEYGMGVDGLICPSSEAKGLGEVVDARGSDAYKAAYAWLSGVQECWQGDSDIGRMGRRVPPLRDVDEPGPLAADIVKWGSTANDWASHREVNHGDLPYVDGQNIAYSDNHVEWETDYYEGTTLQAMRYDYQYNRYSNNSNQFILWFWGND